MHIQVSAWPFTEGFTWLSTAIGNALNSLMWAQVIFQASSSLSYLHKRWLSLRCLKWHWSPLTGHLDAGSALYIHVLHGCPSQGTYNKLGMNLPKHLLLLLFCLCKEMSLDKGGTDLPEQVKHLLGTWEIVGFEFLVWIRQAGFEPGSSTSSGSALIIRPSANHRPELICARP